MLCLEYNLIKGNYGQQVKQSSFCCYEERVVVLSDDRSQLDSVIHVLSIASGILVV